jgi:hypothetical protein
MNTFKLLTLCSSVALTLLGTTQVAHAHAGFKDQITEGSVATWNAVKIGHGCASNATPEGGVVTQKDVIAISALFPNPSVITDAVFRGSKGTVATTGAETTLTDLSAHLVGSTASIGSTIAVTPVTTGNMFINTTHILDDLNKVRGFQSWAGPSPFNGPVLLESLLKFNPADGTTTTTGLAPFGISAIKFNPESCAKKLVIRVAVADWCLSGAKNNADDSRVDVWIGAQTPLFNDPDTMPNAPTVANGIFWPGLTVNRDLALNPLPGTKGFNPLNIATNGGVIDRTQAGWDTGLKNTDGTAKASTKISCADAADYDTVYIEPTAADIDKYLPIPKAKFPKGSNGIVYWPAK